MNRFTWDMRYPDARDFPGLDHVGRQHARTAGAAGTVLGAADRQRCHEDGDALRSPVTSRQDHHRRRSARAVQAGPSDQRQGQRRQRSRAPHPQREGSGQRPDGKTNDAAIKTAGEPVVDKADRGRRRDLSVSKSQQPGPAQLSDPVEQQARRAAGPRRNRRLSVRRISPTRCSRNCRIVSTSSSVSSTRCSASTCQR